MAHPVRTKKSFQECNSDLLTFLWRWDDEAELEVEPCLLGIVEVAYKKGKNEKVPTNFPLENYS